MTDLDATPPKPSREDEKQARRWMDAWLMGWTPAAQEIAVREAASILAAVRAEGFLAGEARGLERAAIFAKRNLPEGVGFQDVPEGIRAMEPGKTDRDATPPKPSQEAKLAEALRHAVEWLQEEGCDCGVGEAGTCALCEALALLATVRAEGEPHRGPRATLGAGQMIDPCHCVECRVAQARDETVARYHALLEKIDAWVDLDVAEHPGLRAAVLKALDECPPACTSPECEAVGYARGEQAGREAEKAEVVTYIRTHHPAYVSRKGSAGMQMRPETDGGKVQQGYADAIERGAHHAKG